jgi:hypothetical protein
VCIHNTRVPGLFKVGEIDRLLDKMEAELLSIAMAPLDRPLASNKIRETSERLHKINLKFYERIQKLVMPHSYFRIFASIAMAIDNLRRVIYYISSICDTVDELKAEGIHVHPNPCETHTLDYFAEWIMKDFKDLVERAEPIARRELQRTVTIDTAMMYVEDGNRRFLERLQILSSLCMHFTGANCLKYASPEKVTPVPLRSRITDLFSVVRTLHKKFNETYKHVRAWKVGVIGLYEHPQTTPELLDLAEYAALALHRMIEMNILSPTYEYNAGVFSLKDGVEITLNNSIGGMIVKPRWTVYVYSYPILEDMVGVLRHILEERGYRTEPLAHVFGFKVTVSPGDVREVLRIACMLPAMPTKTAGEAYEITLSMIESLERELRERGSLKKRKAGL